MMTIRLVASALAGITLLGACGRSNNNAPARDSTAAVGASGMAAGAPQGSPHRTSGAQDTQGMGAMPGMPGMRSGMGSQMMDSMQTQMRMMATMSPDRMKTMLPAYRQMIANMLSQMNTQMRSMNMAADPQWSATVDSIRHDLVQMPELSGSEFQRLMQDDHARVTRLMQMHGSMMGGPKRGAP